MSDEERDQVTALREALARLSAELYEATHALRSLGTQLRSSLSTYEDHGAPFGSSVAALRIWLTYRQFTTAN